MTFVPDFGDDNSDRKICFIASKGTLDMVYPSLVMANAALGEGIETHIFFTFWGMDIVTKKHMEKLQFTWMGNSAMHPPGKTMHMPQGMAGLPGMTAVATKMMNGWMGKANVAKLSELLDMAVMSGVRLIGCQMTMDVMGIEREELLEEVEIGGAATYLNYVSEDAIALTF